MATKSQITKGQNIWLLCEVRKGPFPDERLIHVQGTRSEWVGFVNANQLKEKVVNGQGYVRGVVLATGSQHIVVGIEGQSPTTSNSLQADPSLIKHGTFQNRNNHPT